MFYRREFRSHDPVIFWQPALEIHVDAARKYRCESMEKLSLFLRMSRCKVLMLNFLATEFENEQSELIRRFAFEATVFEEIRFRTIDDDWMLPGMYAGDCGPTV